MSNHTPGPAEAAKLEEALGHKFRQRELLEQALTHSSFAREAEAQAALAAAEPVTPPGDNEQLEFLGDAVLSFVISQELFRRFPEYQEGELSKLRAHIVSARQLIGPARQLEIGHYLRFGKGEEKSGGRSKSALLVNALEALIAALFLDGGIGKAHSFVVQNILEPELADLSRFGKDRFPVTDYKSALQEAAHAGGRPQPRYSVVAEEGPEHRKLFTVEAQVAAPREGGPEIVCRAEGSTKKRAEQKAAQQAFERLKLEMRGSAADAGSPSAESITQA
jgi:ribonuclease-3